VKCFKSDFNEMLTIACYYKVDVACLMEAMLNFIKTSCIWYGLETRIIRVPNVAVKSNHSLDMNVFSGAIVVYFENSIFQSISTFESLTMSILIFLCYNFDFQNHSLLTKIQNVM